MLDGPIGAARFNNEFGRPNLAGYFRTFEQLLSAGERWRGYHKPIMIAGGLGNVRAGQRREGAFPARREAHRARRPRDADRSRRRRRVVAWQRRERGGARLRVGAARQRRDAAPRAGSHRRVLRRSATRTRSLSIHDVGAGGLSNAVPEIVDHSGCGARHRSARDSERRARHEPDGDLVQRSAGALRARDRRARRSSVSPRCATRERCPFAVIGELTGEARLVVRDATARQCAGRHADGRAVRQAAEDDARRVGASTFAAPTSQREHVEPQRGDRSRACVPGGRRQDVPDHIGDRTVGGMSVRDQLVGPWQVPVSDVAVTLHRSTAIAARRSRWASARRSRFIDAPASARHRGRRGASPTSRRRDVVALRDIRLSANWMAAAGHPATTTTLSTHGARRRRGALSRARHRDSGRQGFAVDEDRLARRRRRAASRDRAGVADRVGVRAGRATCGAR